MPTAVLDLEMSSLPDEITGLEAYGRALVLFRLDGIPVARADCPVTGGKLRRAALEDGLARGAGPGLWQRWMRHKLNWPENPAGQPLEQPVSVAICTRDRPDDLRRALTGLRNLPDDGQEILVVDSASRTTLTRAVVAEFPGVRYLREALPGLNRARNRALREAAHPIVAFIDDDAVPDTGWLRGLAHNFSDPQALCVTGLTMPLELESEAQEWFERYSPFSRGFMRRVYDRHTLHPLAAGRAGAGANMALRRSVLDLVGPFDLALDAGTPTQSGGDTEMFARILGAGYKIIYDPAALNWHRHRRTWEELRRALYGYGVGAYAVWTRALLVEGNLRVIPSALSWLLHDQVPGLLRSALHLPGSLPLDLMTAELNGCLHGPHAYLSARRQVEQTASIIEGEAAG